MSLRDDLIAAKALIDAPEKWVKSEDTSTDCRCAALACDRLRAIRWNNNTRVATIWELWEALYRQLPAGFQTDDDEYGECIGRYNDAPETTHADIMALFDRAIAATGSAS